MQQNKAYDIKDITNYSNSNMHLTAGAVERVKDDKCSAAATNPIHPPAPPDPITLSIKIKRIIVTRGERITGQ